MIDDIHVAAAVFGQAVDDEQHGPGIAFGQPGLVVDVGIAHAFKSSFLMLHIRYSYSTGQFDRS
jgi:hypothetical protein